MLLALLVEPKDRLKFTKGCLDVIDTVRQDQGGEIGDRLKHMEGIAKEYLEYLEAPAEEYLEPPNDVEEEQDDVNVDYLEDAAEVEEEDGVNVDYFGDAAEVEEEDDVNVNYLEDAAEVEEEDGVIVDDLEDAAEAETEEDRVKNKLLLSTWRAELSIWITELPILQRSTEQPSESSAPPPPSPVCDSP
ncbi:hypothetical protein CLAIMM_01087 [Cladophialophora immunda]|nr:hypothetical protein CLAIMM_01087 [Cladophialophora immunda]